MKEKIESSIGLHKKLVDEFEKTKIDLLIEISDIVLNSVCNSGNLSITFLRVDSSHFRFPSCTSLLLPCSPGILNLP